jgi:aminopeptidase N
MVPRLLLALLLGLHGTAAQVFTRADSLRGMLSPERTCYDLTFYHLDVRIDPSDSTVEGSCEMHFTVVEPFRRMQVDLFENMALRSVTLDGAPGEIPFVREGNAVFLQVPGGLARGTSHAVRMEYGGKPVVARRPPWLGGFSWDRDARGNPWVVVSCQGTGASCWWPNKDHDADEPDSMLISVAVPPGLIDVSNGRLRGVTALPGGWRRFDWFVSSPINNYNVTVNVADYAHFSDRYVGRDTLTLDYYVLPENVAKARKHFEQVKGMMACFEEHFGEYPFRRDGYKLVESPHTGMEHQSAVAYGNRYLGGYRGRAPSEAGLKFDFIIVHESAHEWWGNSVTNRDVADMWIHESFGAYAEAVYVECMFGYREALTYINGKKPGVGNREPIQGVPNVNRPGSGDMYNKGQLVLNTLRHVIDNDSLWWSVLRGLQAEFRHRTVSGEEIIASINRRTGTDYGYFFDQYLRYPAIPDLEVAISKKGSDVRARYRWKTDVKEFRMPVRVTLRSGGYAWIRPTTSWQEVKLDGVEPNAFRVAEECFYVDLKLSLVYLDPALGPESERPGR